MSEGMDPVGQPNQVPQYEGSNDYSKLYLIGLGVLGFIFLITLIFLIYFISKSSKTDEYISSEITRAEQAKDEEVRGICEAEKREIKENPWQEYTTRNTAGAFKFNVPRGWSQYEHYELGDKKPLRLYFNPDIVKYDDGDYGDTHAALEIIVSAELYDKTIERIRKDIKSSKKAAVVDEDIEISGFQGKKIAYYNRAFDRDNPQFVGTIILPLRDRTLLINTDDYEKYEEYYKKFYESIELTQ